ncbi:MAG: alpha/beta fold hydrolase [Actinomycetes bacterium]
MTTVALFPSVLGIRRGVLDAAELLEAEGHTVLVVDLLHGRVFDDYPTAMAHAWEEVGQAELLRRSTAAVAHLPDGFVVAGFSMGCIAAVHIATQRRVSGVVMIAGAIPVSALGNDAVWPTGLRAQTHSMLADPWREEDELLAAIRDIEAGGGTIEVFDYTGAGHLFTDPTLPDEYDAAATAAMWEDVLAFIATAS